MLNLKDLEKKINSELNTKVKNSKIKHNQIYLDINSENLIDAVMILKTNKYFKFRQISIFCSKDLCFKFFVQIFNKRF